MQPPQKKTDNKKFNNSYLTISFIFDQILTHDGPRNSWTPRCRATWPLPLRCCRRGAASAARNTCSSGARGRCRSGDSVQAGGGTGCRDGNGLKYLERCEKIWRNSSVSSGN